MLDFDRLLGFFRRVSWLGINSKIRASAFLTILLVLLGCLIAAEAFLRGSMFWSYSSIINDEKISGNEKIMLELVGKLKNANEKGLPVVLLIGGSTSRELTAEDDFVSASLSNLCGKDVLFVNAGTSSQSLAQAWAIVDMLREANLKLVVVGYNYFRLTDSIQSMRREIGQSSSIPIPQSRSMLIQHMADLQSIPHPLAIDALHISADLGKSLLPPSEGGGVRSPVWGGVESAMAYFAGLKSPHLLSPSDSSKNLNPFSQSRNLYNAPPQTMEWKVRRSENFLATRGLQIVDSLEESERLWSVFQKHVLGRDAKILYLVLPMDPSMNIVRGKLDPYFDPILSKLEKKGAAIIDWREDKTLSADDFYDQQHLLESGRRKIAEKFNQSILKNMDFCTESAR